MDRVRFHAPRLTGGDGVGEVGWYVTAGGSSTLPRTLVIFGATFTPHATKRALWSYPARWRFSSISVLRTCGALDAI